MNAYIIKSKKDKVNNHIKGCMICGEKLVYSKQSEMRQCHICQKEYQTNSPCSNGHYVCDSCHSLEAYDLLSYLKNSVEKDSVKLLQQVLNHPSVHMHGPEHHFIVPCVLLTSFKNCGGNLDLEESLKEAITRGRKVPGGSCGNWGACGAAIGAGIFVSIVTGSTPLNKEAWSMPNLATSRCLERIASIGGPRCCKRTSFISIETAVDFADKYLGGRMEISKIQCNHSGINKECLKLDCPYFRCG